MTRQVPQIGHRPEKTRERDQGYTQDYYIHKTMEKKGRDMEERHVGGGMEVLHGTEREREGG